MKIFLFPLLIVVECRMLYNANIDRKRVLMEEWKYEKEIIDYYGVNRDGTDMPTRYMELKKKL